MKKEYSFKPDTYILIEAVYSDDKFIQGIKVVKEVEKSIIKTLDDLVANTKNQRKDVWTQNESTYQRSLLEDYYINNNKKSLDTYLSNTQNSVEQEVDYLGEGILGMYDTRTDTVYILKSLSEDVKNFVRAHEHAHRRRAYSGESQNEAAVDKEAEMKVGYNPFGYRNVA